MSPDTTFFSTKLSLQILSELISEVMLLVSMCENDGECDEDAQIGRQNDQSGDHLNHRAYQTVSFFKNKALLFSLSSLINIFQEETSKGKASREQVKTLTDCLKLHTLNLRTARN
jgi:hypothetical protein